MRLNPLQNRLTHYALRRWFASDTQEVRDEVSPLLYGVIERGVETLSADQIRSLEDISFTPEGDVKRLPPKQTSALFALFRAITADTLVRFLKTFLKTTVPMLWATVSQEVLLGVVLRELPPGRKRFHALQHAAIRFSVGKQNATDLTLLRLWSGSIAPLMEEGNAMFIFDTTNLPPALLNQTGQDAYAQAVTNELNKIVTPSDTDLAAVVGMLLLDEHFDTGAYGFADSVQKSWLELMQSLITVSTMPNRVNRDLYTELPDRIGVVTGDPTGDISYQEFASVGRYVITHTDKVPYGHPNTNTQVRLGIDAWVSGAGGFGSLDLPPLVGSDGSNDEIVPDNIRAVALLYAAYNLEQLRLFNVVDRITELWLNGLLPVGLDSAGRALDAYFWSAKDRMTESARHIQYTRVLGAAGGEVSKEAAPNATFNDLLMRFLASVSEYDRQQRISNMFQAGNIRAQSLSGETVRKAGRDLAANASLHGWGYAHFAARRLNADITTALNILKLPQIQKAFGVDNLWQVIERVSSSEFGVAANVVKYRTMAEAGKTILDLVAQHARVWSSASTAPLFPDNTTDSGIPSDISPTDYLRYTRNTEFWLAVNGIKDTQVNTYSQPSEAVSTPSIPTFETGTAGMDDLKKMIAAGKTPSMDDLKKLLPFG